MGTHLGRYGRDLPGEPDLAGLVERLCALPELGRLRLSSLEPLEVTPALIARAAGGKLCRHLHLPLQSGSDAVLRRMARPYDTQTYAELVLEVKRRQPGACLGADVMVGFPGETEAEFAETVAFLEALPLSYLHVFTYSSRPDTPAAALPGQVSGQIKKERNHVLQAISARKREVFAADQMVSGWRSYWKTLARGRRTGLSDNYLEVALAAAPVASRGLVAVEITRARGPALRPRNCVPRVNFRGAAASTLKPEGRSEARGVGGDTRTLPSALPTGPSFRFPRAVEFSAMPPETILVTGAAGFIGSHMCEALLLRGASVVGLDKVRSLLQPGAQAAQRTGDRGDGGARRRNFPAGRGTWGTRSCWSGCSGRSNSARSSIWRPRAGWGVLETRWATPA